jgi:hypothetical protein
MNQMHGLRPATAGELTAVHGGWSLGGVFRAVVRVVDYVVRHIPRPIYY